MGIFSISTDGAERKRPDPALGEDLPVARDQLKAKIEEKTSEIDAVGARLSRGLPVVSGRCFGGPWGRRSI